MQNYKNIVSKITQYESFLGNFWPKIVRFSKILRAQIGNVTLKGLFTLTGFEPTII
jgi:hypothetical protein